MTTGNRATVRTPGRTPPFILVGLLVVVGFLGYCYWSLSSANNELATELENVLLQKKDIDQRNSEIEKNLENVQEELSAAKGSLDLKQKQLQDKDAEFSSLKTDFGIKQADADKFKHQLGECDTSLAEHKSNLDAVKNEKGELEKLLNEARQKQTVCDLPACTVPVREILTIAARITGSEAIIKALSEANVDVKLMDQINFPAPVVQQPQQAQNLPQQAQNPPQPSQNQQAQPQAVAQNQPGAIVNPQVNAH